jgi:hypothetical protein
MSRKQLVIAFLIVSALQWLLLGCAAPRAMPQPHVTLKVIGDADSVEYVAQLELGE